MVLGEVKEGLKNAFSEKKKTDTVLTPVISAANDHGRKCFI